MNRCINIYLSVALLPVLAGCASTPEGVLAPKELASLLADLHKADAYYMVEGDLGQMRSGIADTDSVKKVLRQSVMRDHGVSQKQFDMTLDWYGHNLDRYEEVCDLTIENLEAYRRSLQAASRKDAASESIWPEALSMRLGGGTGRQSLGFRIPGKDIARGSRLKWSFATTALTAPMEVVIAVDYTDGSTALIDRNISSEGRQEISFQTDSTLTPHLLYGFVRAEQSSTLLLDSITITTQPLSRINYYDIHSQRRLPPATR